MIVVLQMAVVLGGVCPVVVVQMAVVQILKLV